MLLLGLAAACLLQEQAPPAGPVEVLVNAQWSFGQATTGDWIPVVVDLQNRTARDLDVKLRVQERSLNAAVTRHEALPANGRRRLFVELPAGTFGRRFGYNLRPEATVTTADGRPLGQAELPSGSLRGDGLLVALVSPAQAREGSFRFPRQSVGREVGVARADVPLLPARWTGYSGIDLLVLHDAPLDELSPDQARAILDWVRMGGTLAVSPGARQGWLGHPVLAALAPIDAGPPEPRTELPGLGRKHPRLFAARKSFLHHPLRNGEAGSLGEIRSYACGLGRVHVLPFDAAQAPFADAAELEAIWSVLLDGVRHAAVGAAPSVELGPDAFSRIAAQANPYPSFYLLVGLTVVFLAVVGPLNWIVLRRLKMTLLIILTVPAISLAFLALTVAIGYVLKGASTVVSSVRIVSTRPGASAGVETQFLSVTSPSTRDYRLVFPSPRAALPAERAFPERNYYEVHDSGPVEAREGPTWAFDPLRIGQWQSRALVAKAPADLGGGVRFETRDGRIRVANGSGLRILRGVVVRRDERRASAVPFGPVEPGAAVEAPEVPPRWRPLEDLGLAEDSVGGGVLDLLFDGMRRKGPDLLVALVEGDDPAVEIDGGRSGRSATVSVLVVEEEKR